MKSTNLRSKPVDKRRLSAQDKEQYQPRQRAKELAMARIGRGRMAYQENAKLGRQEHKPGSGGYNPAGIHTQQQRVREKGQELARSKQLRNETPGI